MVGSTQVAHPCDSPGVVQYFLSTLTAKERNRYLAYSRLEECERPRQLLGWAKNPGQDVIHAVLQDMNATTVMAGRFMTQDVRQKVIAWQTLLSLGLVAALDHVESSVASDKSGHAIGAVLELAACFRLNPVPPRVRDLIAGEFRGMADDSERVSCHNAAIAVARASGSTSALDALLAFKIIREGGVLISFLDALSDTVATLIRSGDASAVERLWWATASDQAQHRRDAAAAALGRLLRQNLLRPIPAARLVSLVEDATLDHYARRVVFVGLGYEWHG